MVFLTWLRDTLLEVPNALFGPPFSLRGPSDIPLEDEEYDEDWEGLTFGEDDSDNDETDDGDEEDDGDEPSVSDWQEDFYSDHEDEPVTSRPGL